MAKVFYKNFSLCCELTNFAVEKVSISNPLFPCVFPFDFPLAIMHHPLDQRSSNLFIPRRKGNNIASRYRFRLRFDPTPLCFPCKILPRISYPGLYSSPFFFFSLFFLSESSSRSYTFPLKILGDRENSDDTFPLFLSLSHPGRFWPLVLSNILTNARGNDRASRSQFISRVKLIFNATMLYR